MKSTCSGTDKGDKPKRVNNRRDQGNWKNLLSQHAFCNVILPPGDSNMC